jgi:hypothetical protein
VSNRRARGRMVRRISCSERGVSRGRVSEATIVRAAVSRVSGSLSFRSCAQAACRSSRYRGHGLDGRSLGSRLFKTTVDRCSRSAVDSWRHSGAVKAFSNTRMTHSSYAT